MKNINNTHVLKLNSSYTDSRPGSDPFFADPVDPREEAHSQTLEAFTRLLIWFAEGASVTQRGIRATVALYCVRPDLINGLTLEQIGEMGGVGDKAVFSIAKDFRISMGLSS